MGGEASFPGAGGAGGVGGVGGPSRGRGLGMRGPPAGARLRCHRLVGEVPGEVVSEVVGAAAALLVAARRRRGSGGSLQRARRKKSCRRVGCL